MENDKYEYGTVIREEDVLCGENSHGKVLQLVCPNSRVLECGPATGTMTRYLKEIMHCYVYIIEYDTERFNHAIQYADEGVCADLEQEEWQKGLPKGSFDYVLCADVLEHLRDPLTALKRLKVFLKPEGSVILSVPNIANGDVIANLLCDQFTYTATGLLDDTHIHFFSRNSLKEMIESAGYHLLYETYIYAPMFSTEQAQYLPEAKREQLKEALMIHPTAGVYQFVCQLSIEKPLKVISDIDALADESYKGNEHLTTFYFNYGQGYEEKNKSIVSVADGRIDIKLPLKGTEKTIRFDPTEKAGCIVRNLNITSDQGSVDFVAINGISIGEHHIFLQIDPQYEILIKASGMQWIHFEGDMYVIESPAVLDYVKACCEAVEQETAQRESMERSLSLYQRRYEILDQQLIQATQNLMASREQVLNTEQALTKCEQQLVAKEKNYGKVVQQRDEAQQRMTVVEQKLTDAKKRGTILAQQYEIAEKQLSNMRQQLVDLEKKLMGSKDNENEIRRQLKVKEQELTKNEQKMMDIMRNLTEAEQTKKEMVLRCDASERELKELEQKLSISEQKRSEYEQELQQMVQRCADIEVQLASAKNKLDETTEKFEVVLAHYELLTQSDSWRLTRPLRDVGVGIRSVGRFVKVAINSSKFVRGLRYWQKNGLWRTIQRIWNGRPKITSHPNADSALQTENIKEVQPQSNSLPMLHGGEHAIQTNATVSIAIPTKDGGQDFIRLLQTLRAQKGFLRIEIVIVDSGSKDDTVQAARDYNAKVIEIRPEEFSHSYARNLGIQNCNEEYVLVMTQDAMPTSEYWLYNMYSVLTSQPDIGAVTLGESPRADSDLYHRVFAWNHYKFLNSLENDIIKSLPKSGDMNSMHSAAQLSDIACFMKLETAKKFPYQGNFAEDLDLGMRLLKSGYKLGFLGHELAIHSHNRPAYYYLKRRYVEFLTLKKLFPDQEIIPYRMERVAQEAVYTFYALDNCFKSDFFKCKDQHYDFEIFESKFKQVYREVACGSFDSQVKSQECCDWLDSKTLDVMKMLVDVYNKIGIQEGERYSGSFIPALEGYLDIIILYMRRCYELVNEDIIGEYKECIGKVFAGLLGTFFAYNYLAYQEDKEKYKEFFNQIGAGV